MKGYVKTPKSYGKLYELCYIHILDNLNKEVFDQLALY